MSKLRPTLIDATTPGLDYQQTYFRVFESVRMRRELIHGHLDQGRLSCAIGTYFRDSSVPINSQALDEIAAYNDSFPNLSPYHRWRKVRAWLKTRIQT